MKWQGLFWLNGAFLLKFGEGAHAVTEKLWNMLTKKYETKMRRSGSVQNLVKKYKKAKKVLAFLGNIRYAKGTFLSVSHYLIVKVK